MNSLNILTINIGNPSLDRARNQVKWLEQRFEDIFVLTETKESEGCKYIANYFDKPNNIDLFSFNTPQKYYVYYPRSITGDLGVMIISKIPIEIGYSIFDKSHKFYSRFAACQIMYCNIKLNIIGLYIPSRDSSVEKINRKIEFCTDVAKYIKDMQIPNNIICGDFNILDRNHIPHYSTFLDWEYRFYDFFINLKYVDVFRYCYPNINEYSWVGRTNDGYRYDYFFVSESLIKNITDCHFLHDTRTTNRITDHSALSLKLTF